MVHILHYCPHSCGVMYEWHYIHFIGELEQHGHTVTDCNPIKVLGRCGNKGEYSQILVDTAVEVSRNTSEPIMLLAASGNDENLEPAALDYLRQLGIPSVNVAIDGYAERLKQRKIAKHYDLIWGMHLNNLALKKYGANVIYLPMAANPTFFHPSGEERARVLAFVGSCYGARGKYVSALAAAGIPMVVRGARWDRTESLQTAGMMRGSGLFNPLARKALIGYAAFPEGRRILWAGIKRRWLLSTKRRVKMAILDAAQVDLSGPVSLLEMVQVYSSAIASLGVLENWSTFVLKKPIYQYTLRDFECPMVGCAHITYRVPELESSFSEDKEMIFYSSLEECVDKVCYYLDPDNLDLCLRIGVNARRRAVEEHSWIARFKKIWETLGIRW